MVAVAQLVRAPLCGRGGRRFESAQPPHCFMQTIHYTLKDETNSISWAVAEQFDELRGQKFYLNQMEATQIEELKGLSLTAKLLLSAVAGAVIQHLIDEGFVVEEIFSSGFFVVD